jgi:Uma2 family endonuclease
MSTVEERSPSSATTTEPLLVDGQRLRQAEFMRRYELTPPGFKAELIGGIVHVASPLGIAHGQSSMDVNTWLGVYYAHTPGTDGLKSATTLMADLSVPQPDVQLRILPEYGGQSRNDGDYIGGAPELVVEVAQSGQPIELGAKRDDYERAGVREYIVVALEPGEVYWHVRRDDKLVRINPDADGIYRSTIFPGLWLDPAALLRKDLAGVIAVLEQGLATPEHAAFVADLADAAARHAAGDEE